MKILTASQQFSVKRQGGYKPYVNWLCMTRWEMLPNWEVAGEPVRAWVNRSAWAGDCPDCGESFVVEPGEPFFCANCFNAKNGGKARPVSFPENREALETVLLKRFNPNTRNWRNETIEELQAENKENGEDS